MSGESPDHPIGEGEDERQSNSEERSARGRSPTGPVNGPRIPRLRRVPARRILHNPAPTHFIDLTGDARDGERPTPPPLVYLNGARYTLEKTATANNRTGAWARENDMIATCKKLEGDPKRQRLITIKEDSDAEIAVEEVNQYIFSKTKEHAQELEKQIPQLLRQAAAPRGRYRSLSDSFRSTPVADEEEMLLTAMAMSLAAEEEECKHRGIDGLRMLSVEEREKCMVKWPMDYSAACGNCEKKIEIGEPYKRCQVCKTVRCRRCGWTLKYRGGD